MTEVEVNIIDIKTIQQRTSFTFFSSFECEHIRTHTHTYVSKRLTWNVLFPIADIKSQLYATAKKCVYMKVCVAYLNLLL